MPEPRAECSRCAGTGLAWYFDDGYPDTGPHLEMCPCTRYAEVDLRHTADGEQT